MMERFDAAYFDANPDALTQLVLRDESNLDDFERLLEVQWPNLTPRTNPGLVTHFKKILASPKWSISPQQYFPYDHKVYQILQRYISWREVLTF